MKRFFLLCAALLMSIPLGCATHPVARESNEVLLSKGLTLFKYGDYDEAQAKFEEVLKEDRNNPHAMNYLGTIYEKRGQYNEALEMYQRAADVRLPFVEEVFNEPRFDGMTITQVAEKNIERLRSIMLSKVVTDLESTRNELALLETTVKDSAGKKESARADEGAATKASEESVKALYEKAFYYLNNNDYERSLAGFLKVLETAPDNRLADNAEYWIGEIYYTKKDYQSALEKFRKVITDYSDGNKVPDAMLKLGYTYDKLNDKKDAAIILNKLVKKYPESDAAKKARERLAGR